MRPVVHSPGIRSPGRIPRTFALSHFRTFAPPPRPTSCTPRVRENGAIPRLSREVWIVAEIAERLRLGGRTNVGRNERIASVVGGAGLGLLAARQKGVGGALLGLAGAWLIARGASGHCFVYDALDLDTADDASPARGRMAAGEVEPGVSVNASITISRPADEVYAAWRDFEQAPRYMDRITRVEILDPTRSRWTATGPMGRSWTWESEVVEDRPGELIAWESLPGAELPNRGWVQFLPAGNDG